jgi:ribonuclease HII
MEKMHIKYPQYQFDKNKGYPTKGHISAIKEFGPTPIHRMTFKPEIYSN